MYGITYTVSQQYTKVKIRLKCDIIIYKMSLVRVRGPTGHRRVPRAEAAAANDEKLRRGVMRRRIMR